MSRRVNTLMLMVVMQLFATGCVRSLPAISHAHIGHALTAWHDTPGEKGLFKVAESEAANAWKELELAKRAGNTPSMVKRHVENIVHSLNPQIIKLGTGSDYGVIPGIQAVIQHVIFAADSRDASENIILSAETLTQYANETVDKFLLALALSRLATTDNSPLIADHLPVLEDYLQQAIDGVDIDRDGVIGNFPAESGLKLLGKMLSDMAANEVDPPYAPIEKHYLLGLVRLPNGRWAYND